MTRFNTDGIIKMLDKAPESENTCYINGTVRHHRGLTRREVSNAVIARFHSKYATSDGCWLWQAGTFAKGYGMINLGRHADGRQHTEYAHRVSYVLANGDVPPSAVVMHSCDTPACVNPAHLSLGSQGDNVADAQTKGHYSASGARRRKLTPEQEAHVIATAGQRGLNLHKQFGVSRVHIARIRRAALGIGYSVYGPQKYRKQVA
jgi:hypothetical protein